MRIKFLTTNLAVFAITYVTTFQAHALQSLAFDWDDTIITQVPEIVLLRNDTNAEFVVSTRDFVEIRHQLGEGKAYRRKPEDDQAPERRFPANFERSLALGPSKWQASGWKAFQHAMQTEESARLTSIITGRQNSRETFHRALSILHARGFIKHVPPLEMIFPVGNKTLFPQDGDVSQVKIDAMKVLLDKLNSMPLTGDGELHYWTFSDDDPQNVRQATEFLSNQVKQGRWPNVKISVTLAL